RREASRSTGERVGGRREIREEIEAWMPSAPENARTTSRQCPYAALRSKSHGNTTLSVTGIIRYRPCLRLRKTICLRGIWLMNRPSWFAGVLLGLASLSV